MSVADAENQGLVVAVKAVVVVGALTPALDNGDGGGDNHPCTDEANRMLVTSTRILNNNAIVETYNHNLCRPTTKAEADAEKREG